MYCTHHFSHFKKVSIKSLAWHKFKNIDPFSVKKFLRQLIFGQVSPLNRTKHYMDYITTQFWVDSGIETNYIYGNTIFKYSWVVDAKCCFLFYQYYFKLNDSSITVYSSINFSFCILPFQYRFWKAAYVQV